MADSPKISIITTDETDDSGSNRDIEVGSSRPQAPSEATKRHPRELLWCIYAIFVLVLSSFDNQAGGVVLSIPQFRKDFGSPYNGNYVLSAEWQSAYSGAPVLSSIVGLLVSGWLADKIGRKWMFAIGYLIVFVSITIETLSTSNLVFFIGKFVAGFAIGAFTTTALTYLGEVAPRPARGILTAAAGMALTVGPFIVSIVVRATGDEPNRWAYRSVFLAQYGFSATGAFLLPCMPESPWWLLSKGRKHEASVALSHFGYTVDQAQDYMTAAITALDHAREETKGATYLECFQKTNLRRTIIAAAPLSIQALSGLFFVSSYSTYYQQLAGYNTSTTFSLNIVQNILAMTGNACSWFLIDRVGRRPLSCYGMLLLTVLLLLTGGLACVGTKSATRGTVGLLLLYNWLYSITIGATAYPILIETPTSRLRTKTAAIGLTLQNGLFHIGDLQISLTTWQAMWAFVIPYLFNPDQANLGARVAFIFGAFAVVSTIYLWSCQPETSGRSFAELDEMFVKKVPARGFKVYKTEAENGLRLSVLAGYNAPMP
ncbi:MFS hexose transporter [Aureobasidium pullulans]|nr:MFS hexose transporter [Aureobasidium pullulans]